MHVLLAVVQRVPELREGRGDDVQHRDACVRGEEEEEGVISEFIDQAFHQAVTRPHTFSRTLWKKESLEI